MKLLSGQQDFDWKKSPAHLAFLATFLEPRPSDKHPTNTPWEQVLGEAPGEAIERFKREGVVKSCGAIQTLRHELPKLSRDKLRELSKERGLPTSGDKEEMVRNLTQRFDPTLLFDVPERYLLQCTDLGRQYAENFLEKGIHGLQGADPHTLEAIKNVLLWMIAEGIVLGVIGGAAYDFLKHVLSASETPVPPLPAPEGTFPGSPSPTAIPEPRPIPPEPPPSAKTPSPGRKPKLAYEPAMVHIPAGYFWMGSDKNDPNAWDDEKPKHHLYLPEYWIGRYPVTVSQFAAFVQETGYITTAEKARSEYTWQHPDGKGSHIRHKTDHPVTCVSWEDAIAYCKWLARKTGDRYTLPSEAEWEKAARGSDGRIYPWGNQWDGNLCNNSTLKINDTTPVGNFSPLGDSPYGCADMAGNVWEWTRSIYSDYPYPSDIAGRAAREDLTKPGSRVLRGGSFILSRRSVRCACRYRLFLNLWYRNFGFRVAALPFSEL
jgi:formylglycine-generating enzyme required for sulfatase activity